MAKRKGIYKDTIFSSNPDEEEMLRPNGCIAMAIASELFDNTNAMIYLAQVECALIKENSIGVKTLDPYN